MKKFYFGFCLFFSYLAGLIFFINLFVNYESPWPYRLALLFLPIGYIFYKKTYWFFKGLTEDLHDAIFN